jgi:hypothetical protein
MTRGDTKRSLYYNSFMNYEGTNMILATVKAILEPNAYLLHASLLALGYDSYGRETNQVPSYQCLLRSILPMSVICKGFGIVILEPVLSVTRCAEGLRQRASRWNHPGSVDP